MRTVRFLLVTACAVASAFALAMPARGQFSIPGIGGVDPRRAAQSVAAKQLAPFITEAQPIRLDPVDLYPTVDTLPGAPFSQPAATAVQATSVNVIGQLRGSTTGVVTLPPGDYAIPVRLFCMSHARPARSPLGFLLGPMRGKRAPAIVAMNSRAASAQYGFSPLQSTSWTIQGGLGLSDFPGPARSIVNALISDYAGLLATPTLEEIQNKWNSLAAAVPGAPSVDSVLGQLGPAGAIVTELRDERATILSQSGDFEALRRSFAPLQSADVSALPSSWASVSPAVWMRMVTSGHYGDSGTVNVRVTGTEPQSVPLVSSIGYGRCTPRITKDGSAYACTQPLSFMPLRSNS